MTGTEKRAYLIRTLSRTKRKDYENYVIDAIWHRLNNLEIKLVSQQYVKHADRKHALQTGQGFTLIRININTDTDEGSWVTKSLLC